MSYQVIPPNTPAELTISLEQGLLLSANPLMKFILEATMARAQALFPLDICCCLTEASHMHFMIFVKDPANVTGFAERFKTESAHYINALLGRPKRTVWCEGYFCAPILTESSAISKLAYIYTNPAKDGLETSIDNYPGLSSWQAFRTGRLKKRCVRLHRPMIPHLPGKFYKNHTYRRLVRDLKLRASSAHTLSYNPNAWMGYFGITEPAQVKHTNEAVVRLIREQEEGFALKRIKEGKTVIGSAALTAAHMDLDYLPERSGKKMWCICDDTALRVAYIEWAKGIKEAARTVYERWKRGDYSVSFPPGVFPPAVPRRANMTALACEY